MTRPRPTRTTIRHGMASCAEYGCKRPECLEARRRHDRRTDRDRARGIAGRVDATPASRRVQKLLQAGMSVTDIADRSGISDSAIRALAREARTRIHRTTHEAVLGMPFPAAGRQAEANGFVDATGATRRLQALSAVGFPSPYLAARIGLAVTSTVIIRAGGRNRIQVNVNQRIKRVYDELWDADPLAHGVRRDRASFLQLHAIRMGWKRPADLDDDLIDTPGAVA